ncbi:hypothetical protein CARUB_v10002969mg [Capsella rubella]|uniref:Uncharacterized protein n=1 Tax=Capsella rubella TaxID=81985 RepID=R0FIX3_9BRAS|nr:hypothetical protein CARUB_v10002969mg [Capsella rubella]
MKGVGGPLLSIGDLLADLGEETGNSPVKDTNLEISSKPYFDDAISGSLDLSRVFQENYEKLNDAFAGSDHSWTSLTLEVI